MINQARATMLQDPWRDMRKVERDPVDFHATFRRPDGRPMDARVVDLSPHGFMVRSDGSFERDERVLVNLPVVGEVTARVAWALGGRIGGQFLLPIAKPRYDELLATAAAQLRRRWPA